jgi:bacillithiol biosynthesis deacetylase BshB1
MDAEAVDVLAVGAHPDDIELGIGGTIHKLAAQGFKVAILDLTRGEMSTRGSIDERAAEAGAAAKILQVVQRENAQLPDGGLTNCTEFQRRIIPFIRRFRPRIVMATMASDRHPDHAAAYALMRDAAFYSGLVKIDTGQQPHRPPRVYYYAPYFEDAALPAFVIDISDHIEAKLEALKAHASQFHNPDYPGKETFISSARFWESIRTRAAYWGNRINAQYGEPFFAEGPLGLAMPPGLEVQ